MLYIRIELWRHGNPNDRTLLGEARIANVSGLGKYSRTGDYVARLTGRAKRRVGRGDVSVKGFPRKSLTAWDLLLRVLTEAFGERNQIAKR